MPADVNVTSSHVGRSVDRIEKGPTMSVMVTGGAGYIGAHVVRALLDSGREVVVVDDLSTGKASRLEGVPLVVLDLASSRAYTKLRSVVRDYGVSGVVHLAAKKQVAESVARPDYYYEQNVGGLYEVRDALVDEGVERLVFSSSAAVYGEPRGGVVDEDAPLLPINPYGQTKLRGEWMLAQAEHKWPLRHVSLRYFNVVGAGSPELGDASPANLIPATFDLIEKGQTPRIFGDDYPTPDGTCVRDYVDVRDVAAAHVAALDYLDTPDRQHTVFNVGTGRGASVRQVLDVVRDVTGAEFEPVVEARRDGDPPQLVASADRIGRTLGWSAQHGLEAMVRSAWEAWRWERDNREEGEGDG